MSLARLSIDDLTVFFSTVTPRERERKKDDVGSRDKIDTLFGFQQFVNHSYKIPRSVFP